MYNRATSRAALEAWKQPKGVHTEVEITTPTSPPLKFSVIRHSRIVLVFDQGNNEIAAYPKPNDMLVFEKAHGGVAKRSPCVRHPGSIGAIKFTSRGASVFIERAQSHFRQSSTCKIPENLARRYSGWRRVAFEEIMAGAKKRRATVYT